MAITGKGAEGIDTAARAMAQEAATRAPARQRHPDPQPEPEPEPDPPSGP